MTPELTVLILAAILQFVQFLLYAAPAQSEIGSGYLMSARDREPSRSLSERSARLKRAFENHVEWLIPYAIAAIVIAVTDQSTWFTAACAWVYLAARLVYIPAYALGWRPGRSIIWGVGWLATLLMLFAALV